MAVKGAPRELLDRPRAEQSYKKAIGYAIQDISDRFE
jgi:hypothetical protein